MNYALPFIKFMVDRALNMKKILYKWQNKDHFSKSYWQVILHVSTSSPTKSTIINTKIKTSTSDSNCSHHVPLEVSVTLKCLVNHLNLKRKKERKKKNNS